MLVYIHIMSVTMIARGSYSVLVLLDANDVVDENGVRCQLCPSDGGVTSLSGKHKALCCFFHYSSGEYEMYYSFSLYVYHRSPTVWRKADNITQCPGHESDHLINILFIRKTYFMKWSFFNVYWLTRKEKNIYFARFMDNQWRIQPLIIDTQKCMLKPWDLPICNPNGSHRYP